MERRTTESSSVHPRKVSDNPLSIGSRTKQALHKVIQFRPPRNEARPAKSTRVLPQMYPHPVNILGIAQIWMIQIQWMKTTSQSYAIVDVDNRDELLHEPELVERTGG
ncbi:hypothetical protein PIB30_005661 [Stylosanthes scabra]|uniref:Uncharacterized protein n=1 Tax=Stylosanthes scabra TaxID=79078 RepID=A0ABU6T3V3_9FABA|nr:hypothetical protein [Stylosanthes scabra]